MKGKMTSKMAGKMPAAAMTTPGYSRLLWMTVLSFAFMYCLMYAMVDRFENVWGSYNQFYMAALMTSPMVGLELLLMGHMYANKRRNALLVGLSAVALVVFWLLIRQQVAIDDRQFLRSMIPHHAGAILMCEQASLKDPRIADLCKGIIASQTEEIARMKALLGKPPES